MATSQEVRSDSAQENSIPSSEEESVLEARFECPICLQCLSEPVLTPCGHRFCNSCIQMWLQREGGVCPVDSQPLNSDSDLFPDNFTRREIHELELKNQQLLSEAYGRLQMSVDGQKMEAKAQEAANLWEPDGKGHTHQNGDLGQQPWQGLVRSLYERIVMLEQRNREQDIQLDNMKRQMSTSIDKISQDLVLRHCGGTYVWTLTQASSKLSTMTANPTRCMFYSPGFYTDPNGYRFCARINLSPNDRSQLALLIHLMRTDHDACLNWPFTGRITFMLINAKDSSRHICDTMMSRPELDAFKRPVRDMNPRGFGYTEFVSLLDLTTQGFVTAEDTVVIKFQVISV